MTEDASERDSDNLLRADIEHHVDEQPHPLNKRQGHVHRGFQTESNLVHQLESQLHDRGVFRVEVQMGLPWVTRASFTMSEIVDLS